MPQKRKALLSVQFLVALGNAMVGVFLPFLLARAFGLSFPEVLLLVAFLFLGMTLTAFLINRWFSQHFSSARTMQVGILLHALFYLVLSFGNSYPNLLYITVPIYVLALMVYWPTFHTITLHTTKEGGRGKFAGYLQIALVLSNVVAPLFSGFLLERNLDGWILSLSILFFVLSSFVARNLQVPKETLPKFSATWQCFRQNFFKVSQLGFWTEAFQGGVLWVIWPLFLQSVLGDFSLMGMIVSISALMEVVSSRVWGSVTDKYSAKKMLKWGALARAFDIGSRSFLIFFPYSFLAGMLSLNAGLLGPVFQLPWYSRTCEIGEKMDAEKNTTLLEFFVIREWMLGVGRSIIYFSAAGATYIWGISVLGWFLLFAGVMSVGFRWQK